MLVLPRNDLGIIGIKTGEKRPNQGVRHMHTTPLDLKEKGSTLFTVHMADACQQDLCKWNYKYHCKTGSQLPCEQVKIRVFGSTLTATSKVGPALDLTLASVSSCGLYFLENHHHTVVLSIDFLFWTNIISFACHKFAKFQLGQLFGGSEDTIVVYGSSRPEAIRRCK